MQCGIWRTDAVPPAPTFLSNIMIQIDIFDFKENWHGAC